MENIGVETLEQNKIQERWSIYHVEHKPRWRAVMAKQPWIDGIEGPDTGGSITVVRASLAEQQRRELDAALKRAQEAEAERDQAEKAANDAFGELMGGRDLLNRAEAAEKRAEALKEVIDFAEEGWAYAADYFREKWRYDERIAELKEK